MTPEELKFLSALQDEELIVQSPQWRARRDLLIAADEYDDKITMQQANALRALTGQLLLSRFPVAGRRFAESDIGEFPYVRAGKTV